MTERWPRVTASQMIRVLEQMGFAFARQSGSHKIYKNAEGRRVTVPYHVGKVLHPKLVKSILADADFSLEQLRDLLG